MNYLVTNDYPLKNKGVPNCLTSFKMLKPLEYYVYSSNINRRRNNLPFIITSFI